MKLPMAAQNWTTKHTVADERRLLVQLNKVDDTGSRTDDRDFSKTTKFYGTGHVK